MTPPPPPGGPRDWSPTQQNGPIRDDVRPAARPIRGAGHIEGLGWARTLAWTATAVSAASLAVALFVPLASDLSRPVWITGFGGAAVWLGLMAVPRYRGTRGRNSPIARVGVGLGVATMAVAIYAFVVIVAASSGTSLPAPSHWVSNPVFGVPALAVQTSENPASQLADVAPVEAERLALVQSVGSAIYALEQSYTSGGAWPTALAVTTDAAALMTPDGIPLTPLPPGSNVLYSTSSDLRDFSLTLTGPLGAIATYESTTGTIASSVP